MFDSLTQGKGGLYITATQARQVSGSELLIALDIQNNFRAKFGKEPLAIDYYTTGGQKMYIAEIQKLEVYSVERDKQGFVKREVRTKVTRNKLL